jgi:hypothetical protein
MDDGTVQVIATTAAGLVDVRSATVLAFADTPTRSLVRSGDRYWLIAGGRGIHASEDLRSWQKVAESPHYDATCLYGDDSLLFVGTEEAHLYSLEGSALSLVDAFEQAPTRDAWFTPWGGPPAVRTISGDPDGRLYVNVHVGGVLRSTPDRSRFEQTIDIQIDVHHVLYDPSSDMLLAAAGKGFAESTDRGDGWTTTTSGLDYRYMRTVTVCGPVLLASASNGPHGDRGNVYRRPVRSTDAFERCVVGLPEFFEGNVDTGTIGVSGNHAAIGSPRGGVYHSNDCGNSWHHLASDLGEITGIYLP